MLSFWKAFSQNMVHAGEADWPQDVTMNAEKIASPSQVMSCAAGTIFTTGYPLWTNYYAGYQFKVNNISACAIPLQCFEARFQGTSGYRIYTKTGTFVGFETLVGSWTLVGNIAGGITGISTVTCTPIPIAVNVTIPAGASQSFYLTRTDNLIATRHLYITGVGTAGTTVYASDANIQITEAEYLDAFFVLQIGVRRPSFDVYYDKVCPLPIELLDFKGTANGEFNKLIWSCATETNNDYFSLERSIDGVSFKEITRINGVGNSKMITSYSFNDDSFVTDAVNYYRLTQVDLNGGSKTLNIIAINDLKENMPTVMKRINLLGEDVNNDYNGVYVEIYSNGSYTKKCNTSNK